MGLFESVLSRMTSAVVAVFACLFFETAGLPGFVLVDEGEANAGVGPFLLDGACFFGGVLLFAMFGVVGFF